MRQNMPNMFDLEHLFLSSRMKGFGGTSVGSSTSLELYVGLSGEFNRLEASSVGVVYSVIKPSMEVWIRIAAFCGCAGVSLLKV